MLPYGIVDVCSSNLVLLGDTLFCALDNTPGCERPHMLCSWRYDHLLRFGLSESRLVAVLADKYNRFSTVGSLSEGCK